jgi:hypothetical protein
MVISLALVSFPYFMQVEYNNYGEKNNYCVVISIYAWESDR